MNSNSYALLAKARKIFTQEQLARRLGVGVRTIRRWEKRDVDIPEMTIGSLRSLLNGTYNRNGPLIRGLPDFRFIDLFAGIGGTR